jgi:predicted Zn-dependent peptidase
MRQQVIIVGAMDHDPVAQWIERQIADLQAAGSNPVGIAKTQPSVGLGFLILYNKQACLIIR